MCILVLIAVNEMSLLGADADTAKRVTYHWR